MPNGFARGLSSAYDGYLGGRDYRENERRLNNQEARAQNAEERAERADSRAEDANQRGNDANTRQQESHDQRMKDLRAASRDAQNDRAYLQAKTALAAGDIRPLLAWYGETFGVQPTIVAGENGDVIDFGNGNLVPADLDTVKGLVYAFDNPNAGMERKRKREDQRFDQTIRREDAEHRAGLPQRSLKTDDEGRLVSVHGDKATLVDTPEGSTFRGLGSGGGQSKLMQDIDTIAERLPPIEGETENQRWMRAAQERAKIAGKNDPQAAVRDFEKSLTSKLLTDDVFYEGEDAVEQVRELIRQLVDDFAARYGVSGYRGEEEDPLNYFAK